MNKWTDEEHNFVIDNLKEGKTAEQIHKIGKLSRSCYAIECRINNFIYDQLSKGITYDKIEKLYKLTKEQVKSIEVAVFKQRNKDADKTQYTDDDGYVYKTVQTDLSEIHNFNRNINTILHFYENIARINKLKKDNIIDSNLYDILNNQIEQFKLDKKDIFDIVVSKQLDNQDSVPIKKEKKTENVQTKKEKTDSDTETRTGYQEKNKRYTKRLI